MDVQHPPHECCVAALRLDNRQNLLLIHQSGLTHLRLTINARKQLFVNLARSHLFVQTRLDSRG